MRFKLLSRLSGHPRHAGDEQAPAAAGPSSLDARPRVVAAPAGDAADAAQEDDEPVPAPAPPMRKAASGGGPPALDRASLMHYLAREETSIEVVPELEERTSRRIARSSMDPVVRTAAKLVLRKEAAEVRGLPHVPSADLVEQLEACLAGGCEREDDRRAAAEVLGLPGEAAAQAARG